MALILSTTEAYNGQRLEIFVKYEPADNAVEEIKTVRISSPVGMIPVGDLLAHIPEFDVALNKIIERTDWREIYRQMGEREAA